MPTTEARLARAETKIRRLRWYVTVLLAVVVFGTVAIPVGVVYMQKQVTDNATVVITCAGYRNQVIQLEALRALERRLGVPVDFTIPEVPSECNE